MGFFLFVAAVNKFIVLGAAVVVAAVLGAFLGSRLKGANVNFKAAHLSVLVRVLY
jgi:hypothetical protein